MFYKSRAHQERLIQKMQELALIRDGVMDPEYGSALYILTSDVGMWKWANTFVGTVENNRGIDFEQMLASGGYSGGEDVLVRLASNLFNHNNRVDPLEFLDLDEQNFKLAMDAIWFRRDPRLFNVSAGTTVSTM